MSDLLELPADLEPEIEELDADQALEVIARERRIIAQANARMSRALARFGELRDAEGYEAGVYAPEEVALALVLSPVSASQRLAEAHLLVTRLPETLAALSRGEIDAWQARAIVEATWPLDLDLARAVEARVLPNAPRWTVGRLRERLRYHLARLDPDGTRERQRERKKSRGVSYHDHGDGMATLSAYLPAERAFSAYQHICDLAQHSQGADDDGRNCAQRQADVFADLVLGSNLEHIRTEIQVLVPASVLAGTSDEPGEMLGTGYLDPDTVRELSAADATWRRILTTPSTTLC